MEIKLPYTEQFATLINKEDALKLIEDIDFDLAFEMAWKGFFRQQRNGYCVLNLITGEYESDSLSDNEIHTGESAVTVTLYKIDKNTEFGYEELLSVDEYEDFEESGEMLENYMDNRNINYMSRVKDFFEYHWDNEKDYYETRAKEELNEWYNK